MPTKAFLNGKETQITDGKNSAIVGGFGELKVSQPTHQIDQLFSRPIDLTRVQALGTYSYQYRRSLLKVSGTAGGLSYVETNKNLRYAAGTTVEFNFTAAWSRPANVGEYSIIGGFDNDDGVYVGWVGQNFVCGYRNVNVGSDVTEIVEVDNFVTDSQLSRFRIRFGYLGVGNITFEIKLGNTWFELHTFETDGTMFERTHVGECIIPMRGEVSSTDPDFYLISGSWAGSTYGPPQDDKPFFHDGVRLVNPTAGTQLPIVAYRSKTTFGGFRNKVRSTLTAAQFATANEGIYKVNFIAYPPGTITTGAWANISPYSVLEANVTSTGVPVGGTKIFSTIITVAGIGSGNSSSVTYNFEGLGLIANPGQEFLITLECVIDSGGTNTETLWCINYDDLF